MKIRIILAVLLVANLVAPFLHQKTVSAQAAQQVTSGIVTVGALSQCTQPVGATITSGSSLCFVNTGVIATSGLAYALNGSTVFTMIGQGAGNTGVTSFNGLTGAILSSTAKISYSDLVVPPTTLNCPTAAQNNAGLTASGCAVK